MPFACFRPSKAETPIESAPRPVLRPSEKSSRPRFASFQIRRNNSNNSSVNSTPSRTSSNTSIALLPPCRRDCEEEYLEGLMMPVPPDTRSPQRCLRISHPRLYASIVKEMKEEKGCRDWRSFAVFPEDDVDERYTAEELARKKAQEYQKKLKTLESFTLEGGALQRARALIP